MYFHQCPSIFIHLLRLLHFLLPQSHVKCLKDIVFETTEVTDLRSEDCRGEGVVPWILYPGMDDARVSWALSPPFQVPNHDFLGAH